MCYFPLDITLRAVGPPGRIISGSEIANFISSVTMGLLAMGLRTTGRRTSNSLFPLPVRRSSWKLLPSDSPMLALTLGCQRTKQIL